MKKIAIFVSGEGEAAERIVKLFNEGNRLRTVLVVADDSAADILERLKDEDVLKIHVPDESWHEKSNEIAALLRDNDVSLIVLDQFGLSLSDEIMEATEGEILRVSTPEQAPREVVAALEADLRKPVEETKPETVNEEENPSPESEWAEALKIRYNPPKVPTTPPDVPETPVEEEQPQFPNSYYGPQATNYKRETINYQQETKNHHQEPMPSTWLIWSVLVTVFCCFIPGIIAIIFSSQVSSRYYAGDIEGAKRASRTAEIWIIVSFVLGVLTATFYFPFLLIS